MAGTVARASARPAPARPGPDLPITKADDARSARAARDGRRALRRTCGTACWPVPRSGGRAPSTPRDRRRRRSAPVGGRPAREQRETAIREQVEPAAPARRRLDLPHQDGTVKTYSAKAWSLVATAAAAARAKRAKSAAAPRATRAGRTRGRARTRRDRGGRGSPSSRNRRRARSGRAGPRPGRRPTRLRPRGAAIDEHELPIAKARLSRRPAVMRASWTRAASHPHARPARRRGAPTAASSAKWQRRVLGCQPCAKCCAAAASTSCGQDLVRRPPVLARQAPAQLPGPEGEDDRDHDPQRLARAHRGLTGRPAPARTRCRRRSAPPRGGRP